MAICPVLDSKIITTNAPIGQGVEPANALFYVRHMDCFDVHWQLDERGWAIGYKLWEKGRTYGSLRNLRR